LYTAFYLPARAEGEPSPTRHGFPTRRAASQYIFKGMCRECRIKRIRAWQAKRRGVYLDDWDSVYLNESSTYYLADNYPACACEWDVVETEKLNSITSWDEYFNTFYEDVIYEKPDPGERSDP
jgi:hypothetical protein